MIKEKDTKAVPCILAPAGSKASFLAALAAGADAVYCGLKNFSARMEAKNFTIEELAVLTQLAHKKDVEVYVTLNSLLKPDDLDKAGRVLEELERLVKPDAIIIQDLAFVQLARQTGFSGELHLSTLANVSFSTALKLVRQNPDINRVVIPRELNIDEIKAMASACPQGLDLELFVHGALCYGVSGRCYWSSYFGGKSGLRGRCVQPCRRLYTQNKQTKRFFSCRDLSLDVLVKVLKPISKVRVWKIEGRKKGPHYVFYTVRAYKMLRDCENDPEKKTIAKKTALNLLSQALGRTGTHYNFLPQRPQNPVNTEDQTGSGLLVGKVQGAKQKFYFVPREELLSGDILRLGYEDESWHAINRVGRYVPKRGRFYLKISSGRSPRKGSPVFLKDRREKELEDMLSELEDELVKLKDSKFQSTFNARLPKRLRKKAPVFELNVYRKPCSRNIGQTGLWLSKESLKDLPRSGLPKTFWPRLWWWLPPVIWPDNEKEIEGLIAVALKNGSRNFVLNAPWQMAFFKEKAGKSKVGKGFNLWAGPFCNLTNALSINKMASFGFTGAIVSPELGCKDYFLLPKHSLIPLGIVISGNWPLSISRILSENLKTNKPFISPKGEEAWVRKYGSGFWVYPNWKMDITAKKNELQKAGYNLFVHLIEPIPAEVKLKKRPGLWNWNLGLS